MNSSIFFGGCDGGDDGRSAINVGIGYFLDGVMSFRVSDRENIRRSQRRLRNDGQFG